MFCSIGSCNSSLPAVVPQSGYLSFLETEDDGKGDSNLPAGKAEGSDRTPSGESRRKVDAEPNSSRRLSAQAAATSAAGGSRVAVSAAASAGAAGGARPQPRSNHPKSKFKRTEASKVTEEQAKIKFLLKMLRFLR